MADAKVASKSSLGFLTRKIGPVPIWLIALAIVAVAYWYEHYGPGAKSASSTTATAAGTDPDTGESYAAELAAAEQQIQDLQGGQPSTAPAPSAPSPAGDTEVPNVVGMTGSAAEALLKARGFKTSQTPATTAKGKVTTVTAQSPGPSPRAAGTTVHLTLTEGTSTGFKSPTAGAPATPDATAGIAQSAAQLQAVKPRTLDTPSRWRNAA